MRNLLIYLIIILISFSCQNDSKKNEIKPKRSNITESVYASVKITPEISYSPQPLRSGIIDEIFVNEGDLVKKEQILFQIIPNTNINSQLTDAQINLKEAKSNYLGQNSLLNNIALDIKTTKELLQLDSINFKRQKRLLDQNIGKRIDYDQIKLKYANTKNQLEQLEQKYIQTENTLKTNYQKALNNSKTGKTDLKDFTVRAKLEGKVYSVYKEKGDFISAQEKFAEIGSYSQFKIEMNVDEVDITKIKLNDTVLILLDAYDKEVFLAKMTKIFPKKNELSQTFSVESEFINQPEKLYYGLSGEANIIISKRNNALVIPTDYLLSNNKVLTTEGETDVKVGIKNLEFVEILTGIDTTTSLFKPQP